MLPRSTTGSPGSGVVKWTVQPHPYPRRVGGLHSAGEPREVVLQNTPAPLLMLTASLIIHLDHGTALG